MADMQHEPVFEVRKAAQPATAFPRFQSKSTATTTSSAAKSLAAGTRNNTNLSVFMSDGANAAGGVDAGLLPELDDGESALVSNENQTVSNETAFFCNPQPAATSASSNKASATIISAATLVLKPFASVPSLDFGEAQLGEVRSATLTLSNPSAELAKLTVKEIPVDAGFAWQGVSAGDVIEIAPKGTVTATLRWTPVPAKPAASTSTTSTNGKTNELASAPIIPIHQVIKLTWHKGHMELRVTLEGSYRTAKKPKALRPASQNAANMSQKPSFHANKAMLLRKAHAVKEQAMMAAKAAKKPVAGVAKSKLSFLKAASAAPLMPFAGRSASYDTHWMDKQERGFVKWLNFVLAPNTDLNIGTVLTLGESAPAAMLGNITSVAPRPFAARRALDQLRRRSCEIFQSEEVSHVLRRMEAAVDAGQIGVREHHRLLQDVGAADSIVNLLFQYNLPWLRVALETVFGRLLVLTGDVANDKMLLARCIRSRLLFDEAIAQEYTVPNVPNSFKDGFSQKMNAFTVKRLLAVVYLLDKSKQARIMKDDPCLFRSTFQLASSADKTALKASADLLEAFAHAHLTGAFNILRALSLIGFTVQHKQTYLDEFDFTTTNIAIDLRDGLRLARLTERLTNDFSLSAQLSAPATTKLHKTTNVDLSLKKLAQSGIALDIVRGDGVHANDIVDGHREKTLALLWKMIFQFQVELMIDEGKLRQEIATLRADQPIDEDCALDTGLYFSAPRLSLLLQWCQAVASHYNVAVRNFTTSFADGRVLCYLLHHYYPSLLPREAIRDVTTASAQHKLNDDEDESEEDGADDDSCITRTEQGGSMFVTFNPDLLQYASRSEKRRVDNEKQNFQVFEQKLHELGGVPLLLTSSDMTATMPQEKVVITFVSYLCTRLLEFSNENRAVSVIQSAWRQRKQREQARTVCAETLAAQRAEAARLQAEQLNLARILREEAAALAVKQTTAAVCIQSAIRGRQVRVKLEAQRQAAAQSAAMLAAQQAAEARRIRVFCTAFVLFTAATSIQRAFRAYQARLRLAAAKAATELQMQRELAEQKRCNVLCTGYVIFMAAVSIQRGYRAHVKRCHAIAAAELAAAQQLLAAVTLQRSYRAMQGRRKLAAAIDTARRQVAQQAAAEAKRCNIFVHGYVMFMAATKIQRAYRSFIVRREVSKNAAAEAKRCRVLLKGHAMFMASVQIQRAYRHCCQRRQIAAQAKRNARLCYAATLFMATVRAQRRMRARWLARQLCMEKRLALLARAASLFMATIRIQRTFRSVQLERQAAKEAQLFAKRCRVLTNVCHIQHSIMWTQRAYRVKLAMRAEARMQRLVFAAKLFFGAVCLQRRLRARHAARMTAKIAAARIARLVHAGKLFLATVRAQRMFRAILAARQAAAEMLAIKAEHDRIQRLRSAALWYLSAIRVQRAYRQHAARRALMRHTRAITKVQALWRGRAVRIASERTISQIRQRLMQATAQVQDDMRLGNRARSALEMLLTSKKTSMTLRACNNLDVVTQLSEACCETMVRAEGAVPILLSLISSCNRSPEHMEILTHALNILLHLVMLPSTVEAVFAEPNCVNTIAELLQMFRDKDDIFVKACQLLIHMCNNPARVAAVVKMTTIVQRIRTIQSIVQRKFKLEQRLKQSVPKLPAAIGSPASPRASRRLKQQCEQLSTVSSIDALVAMFDAATPKP
ncbi:hypothetical protein CAOG_08226 [Capsaspora owczarzaki ATCC 30864]|uniref:Calponin-homology (CH) domain-containing protein n=1 Tax=Capsaspora owczarzaki (strain ATCC 30864) TaxID=595528 RepID=A0A0D2WY01_CAPO3|nr:hypothetical protein CAOG_08226 [Capsaspora owczarzaki ATCC 30864]KJE98230.1 hypothetical protein CAOG_008226 [Capsaspora owczarzaki ATCC 30864]|eukprot:XP_004342481.1 hypothetical protein CAOG_08226 [Capsaspora owczarzaki ATCC 30864]